MSKGHQHRRHPLAEQALKVNTLLYTVTVVAGVQHTASVKWTDLKGDQI